ncbi:uncharacterized protein V6R79_010986 [Siganus canaliculatus]
MANRQKGKKHHFKRAVKLDKYTTNWPKDEKNPPCLDTPNGRIWLDWPEEDYYIEGGYWPSARYFCSNEEYMRDYEDEIPGAVQTRDQFISEEIMQESKPPGRRGFKSPIPKCPAAAPWILNTVYVQIKGKRFSLKWGPNYADPWLGIYVEISLGPYVIWTNSAYMSARVRQLEKNPFRYILLNQHLKLRTREEPYHGKPPPIPDVFYEAHRLQAMKQEYHAKKMELIIEPDDGAGGTPQPLYTSVVQSRGGGERERMDTPLLPLTRRNKPEPTGPPESEEDEPKDIDGKRRRLRNRHRTKQTTLCLCVTVKIAAVITGLVTVLFILYHYGSHPWALTHTRVQYGTTKTVQQACWIVEPKNTFWVWERNQTTNLTESRSLKELLATLNNTEEGRNLTSHNEGQTLTAGLEVLQDVEETTEGLLVRTLLLKEEKTLNASCTWIRPEPGPPRWYCSWGCRPLSENLTQGYWEKEAVFPAPLRNDTCSTVLPKWKFWGHYNLTCENTRDRKSKKPTVKVPTTQKTTQNKDNSTTCQNATTTPTPTPTPGAATPLVTPRPGSTLQLIDPDFSPEVRNYRERFRNITADCVRKQLTALAPCFWNVNTECKAQDFMVLTRAVKPQYYVLKNTYGQISNAYHEDWLNNTLPWVWKVQLNHFTGNFQEGYLWTGTGLKGPYRSDMYVQKLPKPDELMSAPAGDFQRIDQCVAERLFQELNGTTYVSDGKSPRCPITQVETKGWGTWTYDCAAVRKNQTIKGVLQAWKEGYERDNDVTWWGLERAEVKEWVLPCLTNTSSYWVKYQYIATVYAKDRDVWPGVMNEPEPFVSPRPWSMTCDQGNTTCTISLARRHCKHVPGWEDHCQAYYGEEYETYGHQVVWKKVKGTWRRSFPPRVGCAKAILGHGMSKRKEVRGQIVPFVANPKIVLAEGHAFRKSLCEGKEIIGFGWLGPNRMYNNGTCHSPEEQWMRCGTGVHEHECTWFERAEIAVGGTINTILEETAGIIEEGFEVVTGWIGSLFAKLWPYLLMIVGLIITGVIGFALVKGGLRAALRPCGRNKPAQDEDEKPLLRKEEERSRR